MYRSDQHIIQKVYVEVDVGSAEHAYTIKDNIESYLNDLLMPRIQKAIEALELAADELRILNTWDLQLDLDSSFLESQRLEVTIGYLDSIIFESLREELRLSHQKLHFNKSGDFSIAQEVVSINKQQSDLEVLLHFLDKGHLPWWFPADKNHTELIEGLLFETTQNKDQLKRLIQALESSSGLVRLVRQFSDSMLWQVYSEIQDLHGLSQNEQFTREVLLNRLRELPVKLRNLFWNLAMVGSMLKNDSVGPMLSDNLIDEMKPTAENRNSIRLLLELLNDGGMWIPPWLKDQSVIADEPGPIVSKDEEVSITKIAVSDPDDIALQVPSDVNDDKTRNEFHKGIQEDLVKHEETEHFEGDEESLSRENDAQTYYVQNAGLILLHPFLKAFMNNCGLLAENNSILDQDKAVHLLHFLATGGEKAPEHRQLMEKFLCDVPMQYSINREVSLTNDLKSNSEELLKAVMGHMPQLKSTDISLLRNEFLQREGKLFYQDGRPKLIVERKTQDILLDRLAWNISIIKLPWMNEILRVDW